VQLCVQTDCAEKRIGQTLTVLKSTLSATAHLIPKKDRSLVGGPRCRTDADRMEGSGPAPGNHAESLESRSILGLVSLTTLLRAVWLTEHTRTSEPGLAGVRGNSGGIQAVVE
jgi:hypothetical protein